MTQCGPVTQVLYTHTESTRWCQVMVRALSHPILTAAVSADGCSNIVGCGVVGSRILGRDIHIEGSLQQFIHRDRQAIHSSRRRQQVCSCQQGIDDEAGRTAWQTRTRSPWLWHSTCDSRLAWSTDTTQDAAIMLQDVTDRHTRQIASTKDAR